VRRTNTPKVKATKPNRASAKPVLNTKPKPPSEPVFNTKPEPAPAFGDTDEIIGGFRRHTQKAKPVKHQEPSSDRNHDRHSPGYMGEYMREYMRRRRAKQR
jgi:hypothetical protein